MKNKFIKIFISLVLLITPMMYLTHNVSAAHECVWIDTSKISLSRESLLDSSYLNSPQIKEFLVRCIEQSECLQQRSVNEIKFKFMHIEFFCFDTSLYDKQGRPLLRLWVPANVFVDHAKGTLYTIPLEFGLRLRSHTI